MGRNWSLRVLIDFFIFSSKYIKKLNLEISSVLFMLAVWGFMHITRTNPGEKVLMGGEGYFFYSPYLSMYPKFVGI